MKNLVILFAVLLLAAFILLPAATNGKYNVSKPVIADGWPLPPPVPPYPPGSSANTLVADGWPLPPPVPPYPPGSGANTLVADGWPLPPPVPPYPPSGGNAVLSLV